MFPHERSLVQRMQGKPFALLGVDEDESREKCKKVMEENHLTWRSWWDGDHGGPIAEKYNVEGFPTILLIDAKGRIRKQYVGAPDDTAELDRLIDQLVQEAEKGAASS